VLGGGGGAPFAQNQTTASPEPVATPESAKIEPAPVGEPSVAPPNITTTAESAGETKLRFQFRHEKWRDVLDWFARKADLSLVMDTAPAGTCNLTDQRDYTIAEALDQINGLLLTKGYTLVRRGRMLMVINLEDGIPDNLVPTIPLEELAEKGEHELVKVLFNLEVLRPDEAQAEIQKLLGPQGAVVPLMKSRQIWVTDTAGRLRVIRSVLERIGEPVSEAKTIVGAPQLKIHPIVGSDPQSVLSVVQTLLAGQADVRLSIDPKTNHLIAWARPAQQATIAATLAQMEREGQRTAVLRLTCVDPATAVLAINKLFGNAETGGTAAGPVVDADPVGRQLMIRGTEAQIAQIRDMLMKMGERSDAGGATQSSRVRTLPMTGAEADVVIRRIQEIWPTLRANPLRVVDASSVLAGERAEGRGPSVGRETPSDRPEWPRTRLQGLGSEAGANRPSPQTETEKTAVPNDRSTELNRTARFMPAALQSEEETPAVPSERAGQNAAASVSKRPAPIIISPGPNGLMITSEDAEALDELERLLGAMTDNTPAARGVVVYYLKHAKAADIGQTLEQILAGQAANGGKASASASGPVKITPEPRLNALFIQAGRAELNTIDQLLKTLDLAESPEGISLVSKPRRIAVHHVRASEVVDILKQVYIDRLAEGAVGNQQRISATSAAMLAAGMRGERPQPLQPQQQQGGVDRGRNDAVRLALGVDARSNSVIVAAPDSLYEEVRRLIEEMDAAAAARQGRETVRVVAVHGRSLSAVGRAVEAIGGQAVQVKTPASAAGESVSPPARPAAGSTRQPSQQQSSPLFRRTESPGFQSVSPPRGESEYR